MGKEATRVRRRERKNIASGVAHVNSSFNNTMITITDAQGNTIAWSSAGTMGFKGSRKSTPLCRAGRRRRRGQEGAGTRHAHAGSRSSRPRFGPRIGAARAAGRGLHVTSIRDVTPIPHNGCRPRKRRRV
jgi:small subunit ribosomal protein S11